MKDFGKLTDVATARRSHLYLHDVLSVLVSTKMKNRKSVALSAVSSWPCVVLSQEGRWLVNSVFPSQLYAHVVMKARCLRVVVEHVANDLRTHRKFWFPGSGS